MDATARTTNVIIRLNDFLDALSLPGSPDVFLLEQRRTEEDEGAFVRYKLSPLGGVPFGHKDSSTRLTEERELLSADVYWPKDNTSDRYALRRVADFLFDSFEGLSLDFKDYSSTPDTPSDVLRHPIRVIEVPRLVPMADTDGYTRIRVQARIRWVAAHPY